LQPRHSRTRLNNEEVVVLEAGLVLQQGELDSLTLAGAIGIVGQHARLLIVDNVVVLIADDKELVQHLWLRGRARPSFLKIALSR
jgi:hypothetical protein